MNTEKFKELVVKILQSPFEREGFIFLVDNLFKNFQKNSFSYATDITAIEDYGFIHSYEVIRKTNKGQNAEIIIVRIKEDLSSEYFYSALEYFISRYVADSRNKKLKKPFIAAFVLPCADSWMLSFVQSSKSNNIECFYWCSAGKYESSCASQKFLTPLLKSRKCVALNDLKNAFDGRRIRKDFLEKFKSFCISLEQSIQDELRRYPESRKKANMDVSEFVISLLTDLLFLFILEKKGFFVCGDRSEGYEKSLKNLFEKNLKENGNYYRDVLLPTLKKIALSESSNGKIHNPENSIPLFHRLLFKHKEFDNTLHNNIRIPNDMFSSLNATKDKFIGDGILDFFGRYNYKLKDDEINEISMSITPEVLGQAFENLKELKIRKKSGTFYTPQTIVKYMCRESLKNYLTSNMNAMIKTGDIENLIECSEPLSQFRLKMLQGGQHRFGFENCKLLERVIKRAREIDGLLDRIRVCDPGVGSGAFVSGMLSLIVGLRHFLTPYLISDENEKIFDRSEGGRSLCDLTKHAIENCIYGVDIDGQAVEMTKIRLLLRLAGDLKVSKIYRNSKKRNLEKFKNIDFKIKTGNSLLSGGDCSDEMFKTHKFDFREQFPEVFGEKNGFDIIIGNPPYIGERGNKEVFRTVKKGKLSAFYSGKMDYFYFFFHLALNVVKEKGIIAFITTDYFPTATGAKKLRFDLKNRAIVRSMTDFNGLKIFNSAQGQHNMITVLEKGKNDEALARVSKTQRKGFATSRILMKILDGNDSETLYSKIKQKDLYEGNESYIRTGTKVFFGNNEKLLQRIFCKIEIDSVRLDLICNINQGIVTGADKVTKKHIDRFGIKAKKGEGIYVLSDAEVSGLNLDEKERGILKPWFKNSSIFRWYTEQLSREKVIYADKKSDNLNCDKIKNHLEKYKKILDNSSSNSPYLHRPRGLDFEGEKIVVPQRSPKNTFGYNKIPWYASADVYFITEKDRAFPLKYILAILNSKLYYVWLYSKGKRKGCNLELYQKPLSEIPVKKVSKRDMLRVVSVVEKILETPHGESSFAIGKFENDIDLLIYKIYGLSSDEIRIIESINNPGIF
ncbi:Eco57I restriction-modification methylase domain-containing protein [candidate division WOR-3 bacterium]|nr:Eco57I restriction-modification methylase domain-containing protein [candidate division WOR-3 bacterium]